MLYVKNNGKKYSYGERPDGSLGSSWEWRIGIYTDIEFTLEQIQSNSGVSPLNNPVLKCPSDPHEIATSKIGFARPYVSNSTNYWYIDIYDLNSDGGLDIFLSTIEIEVNPDTQEIKETPIMLVYFGE